MLNYLWIGIRAVTQYEYAWACGLGGQARSLSGPPPGAHWKSAHAVSSRPARTRRLHTAEANPTAPGEMHPTHAVPCARTLVEYHAHATFLKAPMAFRWSQCARAGYTSSACP